LVYYFSARGKVPENVRIRKREIHKKRAERHAGKYEQAFDNKRLVGFPMVHFFRPQMKPPPQGEERELRILLNNYTIPNVLFHLEDST
jgi:hypothetical protein